MPEACEEVAPRKIAQAVGAAREGGEEGGKRERLAEIALIEVALNCHRIAGGRLPVKP
ncbi:hypothetical protein [Candidatus Methylomirabilis limnetica]|uniref:hypothetical protein n=1 Tax=Candidatus Methylomirabilis limnetica TaxID=2033718 RepID=UPI00137A124E|nr:hypothetical protein [Candidatus Methylomirabilis limnetica]